MASRRPKRAKGAAKKVAKKSSGARPKPAGKKASKKAPATKAKARPKSAPKKPGDARTARRSKGASEKPVEARTTLRSSPSPESGGLSVGDAIPTFALPDQDGNVVSSDSLRGEPYVLYFYPKDDTPGCTKEACGFRDDIGRFHEKGVRVLGVSPDKPESHARFRAKYGLNFTLLSDVDKALIEGAGVWVKKQNYGREYMGVERSTFLVGGDGRVQKVWRRVRVDGHVGDVLGSV